jgi:hypothetical protein
MILVGGGGGYFEGARKVIAGFFKWTRIVNEGMVKYVSDDFRRKGSAADDETALREARELGRKLASKVVGGYEG